MAHRFLFLLAAFLVAAEPAQPVHIDAGMVQNARGGPIFLTKPDTNYVLDQDIHAGETAIVIGAPGINLDLAGHSVVFGDSPPLPLINGSFEEGNGRTVPGWDLSRAPGAQRVPAAPGMWGQWMLLVDKVSGPQTIISEPVKIPYGHREYVAAITPKAPWKTLVKLSVIDAAGNTLATSEDSTDNPVTRAANPDRGYAAVAAFTPRAEGPVRLQVDIAPPKDETVSVALDYATLTTSRDYGICASQVSGARGAMPAQLWGDPAFRQAYARASSFTVRNGTVVQGQGRGAHSPPLFFAGLKRFTVDDVETYACGMDTHGLDAHWGSNGLVQNSCFVAGVDRISNRMRTVCGLSFQDFSGTAIARGNQFVGQPQTGILFNGKDVASRFKAEHNYFRQNASAADGYGITVAGAGSFDIVANTIVPVSGRGILLDSWGRTPTQNGNIRDNYCRVREAIVLEYSGQDAMEPTALRVRAMGETAFHNINVVHNTFAAVTGRGSYHRAIGCRVSLRNPDGKNNAAGVKFSDNLFRAVAETSDPAYEAWALSLSVIDPGTGIEFTDNTCESNDVGTVFGDPDGWQLPVKGVALRGTTYRIASGAPERPFVAALVGAGNNPVADIVVAGSKFGPGTSWTLRYANDDAKKLAGPIDVQP